ncbi:MAG: carbohydrate ABC transporter permease [Haloplanus sp.]
MTERTDTGTLVPSAYRLRRLTLYVLAGVAVVVFAFPVYWLVLSSLKEPSAIRSWPPSLFTLNLTLDNFKLLITETNFPRWFKNSIIITTGNIIFTITLATTAGYALTRYDIPQKKNLARMLLLTYMFPPILLGIPYFILFDFIGLQNTLLGIMLAHASLSLPFGTWIMWQFFQTVPISWEESAWVCGTSRLRSMVEIALPGAFPGIVAVAIFTFSVSWNDFTLAFMLTTDPSVRVLTVGIRDFMTGGRVLWGDLTSAGVLLILPPMVLIFFLNKYILEGFSMGGFEE